MLWGERRGNRTIAAATKRWSSPMPQLNDLSKSLVALEQDATLIAVIEMGQSSWLVAGIVPGVERQPLKKLTTDQDALLQLLHRWRKEANEAGHVIKRITVAYEAGRDGFWLARWLRAHGIEAYVIHPSSVPVSREHRRAKTDRLDTELLKRAFLGWLRGEPKHCSMAAVPTIADEDARRPSRERENLVKEVTRLVNRRKLISPGSAFAASGRTWLKRPGNCRHCKHRRVLRCRRTRWPSCGATWIVCASSSSRSSRSRRHASSDWKASLENDAMPWSTCWLGWSASALKAPTCSCRRCSRASCVIAGPSRGMRV